MQSGRMSIAFSSALRENTPVSKLAEPQRRWYSGVLARATLAAWKSMNLQEGAETIRAPGGQVLRAAEAVRTRVESVVIPTYMPAPPDKNPMFLEKRVYQGSSGKV